MRTQEEEIREIVRPTTPNTDSQTTRPTQATPVRHRGISSAAVSSSKWTTVSKINLDDIVEPIKNEISKPQDCKAADMLHFLFSFCDTGGDAAGVRPKDEELMAAFKVARNLANEQATPLRNNLNLAFASKDEVSMYSPLTKAFNYALDRLSKFDVPGLPEFQENRQIVFARSAAKCIGSESYLQGSYKPDIILVKWDMFKRVHGYSYVAYSMSYESDICCESGRDQPRLSWRNLLSTLEVKRGGKKSSKGKAYTKDFGDLEGDLGEVRPPESPQPAPLRMVSEENPIRAFGVRTSPRTQEPSPSTSDRKPLSLQKRRRNLHESDGKLPKKLRITRLDEAGEGEGEASGEQGGEEPNEPAVEESRRPQKQGPKVQSAIYASHKISSSFDISHTINLLLIGTSFHITWIDRQNVIESRVIDLVDDLPHFLLLLLILQRFDDAKWGYFTECPYSGLKVEPGEKLSTVSFVTNTETDEEITIVFYPDDHEIYLGTTLIGRGTSVIGGRRGPSPETTELVDTSKLREGNDLVVKIYWPEEKRRSEVEILKKAKEHGKKIDLIGNHIPEMICHRDPNFLCSSTKTIRQFLDLPTDGARCLRVIVFRRLRPIKELKEKDMLNAYLQCFFCHFCLWKKGIQHGDISLGNLMWDDERKVGILNDFDLARFADQEGASGQDNTGTLPFMALDLLTEKGLRGEVPRRYRHEAESFAWSLICLCLATVEDEKGKNYTMDPHPLLEWFQGWNISHHFKLEWHDHDRPDVPLAHPNTKALARALHKFWVDRYMKQFPRLDEDVETVEDDGGVLQLLKPKMSKPIEVPPYEEPEDEDQFRELVVIHSKVLHRMELTKGVVAEMSKKYMNLDWSA